MSIIDDLLSKAGLKYEELKPIEKETLNTWLQAFQQSELNVGVIKQYIATMRDAVEQELTKTGNTKDQDILLKARLRNYMLLEAFLSTPEKAKQQMENAIAGLANSLR
ncbi:MAG: hypothetical protein UU51_C0035G0009 [Microgenomates group bacterium GW2011_GWC1_41_20]|nr:MAG: hypothetical protein UU51_C0035G0009 [Microgenomates group bacterium GW2011_GWC1_41_20]